MSNAYIEHVQKKKKELSKIEDEEKSEESDTLSSATSVYADGSGK